MTTPEKQNGKSRKRKRQSGQQQSEQQDGGQQGGWDDNPKVPGRDPPATRDRDYDPDGDRVGPDPGTAPP